MTRCSRHKRDLCILVKIWELVVSAMCARLWTCSAAADVSLWSCKESYSHGSCFVSSFSSHSPHPFLLIVALRRSPSDTSSVDNENHVQHGESNRWANMPVRYFRFIDENDGRVTPVPENGTAWSWRTFLSYAGPGFLVASTFIHVFVCNHGIVSYLDPGNLEADLQVEFPTNPGNYFRLEHTPNIN